MHLQPLDFTTVISIAKGIVMIVLPFMPLIAVALFIGKKRR